MLRYFQVLPPRPCAPHYKQLCSHTAIFPTKKSVPSMQERILVEIWGFEPQTYTLRTYRATNCAISPYIAASRIYAVYFNQYKKLNQLFLHANTKFFQGFPRKSRLCKEMHTRISAYKQPYRHRKQNLSPPAGKLLRIYTPNIICAHMLNCICAHINLKNYSVAFSVTGDCSSASLKYLK